MDGEIIVEGIKIKIVRKSIKNMYIRVLPPDGVVTMSLPKFASEKQARKFATSKLEWIRKNQSEIQKRPKRADINFLSGEAHFLWGEKYTLEVLSSDMHRMEEVSIENDKIYLKVKAGDTVEMREQRLNRWYKKQLEAALPEVIARCEKIVGKHAEEWRIRNMKTRWGTCNTIKKRIWLNLQLVKKKPECLEYVVIHELIHLYTRNHNREFYGYMDRFYPQWKSVKKSLTQIF